jgi:hypothetical protein
MQVSRLRPFMGQITLSLDERNEILAKIKLGREMMTEINLYTQGVPEWAKVDPFGKDQPRFDQVLDAAYNESDAVREIDTRLSTEGPWRRLTEAEAGSFATWFNSIGEMYGIYQGAKPDANADVRTAGAAGVVAVLFTIAIMGA